MKYRIVFKRTTELSIREEEQVVGLFNRVFRKEANLSWFDQKYCLTVQGYSYHGLLLFDDEVVGAFNAIPYKYKYFGKEAIFALSVDTMIDPDHRGGNYLMQMGELVYEAMRIDGIPFILGFPNEYYYKHEKRIFGTNDIAELDYYILPLNIGTLVSWARIANPLSRFLAKTWMGIGRATNQDTLSYPIEKVDDEQCEKHRYDESYKRIQLGANGFCVRKTYNEDVGTRVTYIIDVVPLTPVVFAEAVCKTYESVKTETDMIMYVGKQPFSPPGLFRVPDSKKPQRIRMTGKILIPEVVNDSVFDIKNWNVNISNFDVR